MSKRFFYKLFHWEYWPLYMFYIPNLPLAIYLALKAKNLVFFTAVNPSIKNSGNGAESKFENLKLISPKYRPKSILATSNETFQNILKRIQKEGIDFPLIAKPDIGFRGLLVSKIDSKTELKKYLKKYKIDTIIQEFITHKKECGIFYYRIPGEDKGLITSITLKKFLTITGDGTLSISELVLNDKRARIYIDYLNETLKKDMSSIPEKNKVIILTVIGNHCKGTQFIDGNHLISTKLTKMLNELSEHIDGWFYGRIDLKYDSFELLEKGENFKIIEINGIISEPTHIYDVSKNSYFDAIKAIGQHWRIIYTIGTTNFKQNAIQYTSSRAFIKELFFLRKYTKKLKKLSL